MSFLGFVLSYAHVVPFSFQGEQRVTCKTMGCQWISDEGVSPQDSIVEARGLLLLSPWFN